ncbi:MAG TPA: hypothetical protein VMP68_32840 [Candidatus Eisenbacteria bacterium]|nr:hypothetical protein [Candidatus Eisenbacteria bacterium]
MDCKIDEDIQVLRQIEQADPKLPLGYVLESDANWWEIYLTEGNLTDPNVFEAPSEAVMPYDAEFQRLNNLAIQKAEAQIQNHQDEAGAHLYEVRLPTRCKPASKPCGTTPSPQPAPASSYDLGELNALTSRSVGVLGGCHDLRTCQPVDTRFCSASKSHGQKARFLSYISGKAVWIVACLLFTLSRLDPGGSWHSGSQITGLLSVHL